MFHWAKIVSSLILSLSMALDVEKAIIELNCWKSNNWAKMHSTARSKLRSDFVIWCSKVQYEFITITTINCFPACRCTFSMAILSHPLCIYHIITNFQNGLCCIPHFAWKTFPVDNQPQHRHTHHHCVNNLHVPPMLTTLLTNYDSLKLCNNMFPNIWYDIVRK